MAVRPYEKLSIEALHRLCRSRPCDSVSRRRGSRKPNPRRHEPAERRDRAGDETVAVTYETIRLGYRPFVRAIISGGGGLHGNRRCNRNRLSHQSQIEGRRGMVSDWTDVLVTWRARLENPPAKERSAQFVTGRSSAGLKSYCFWVQCEGVLTMKCVTQSTKFKVIIC